MQGQVEGRDKQDASREGASSWPQWAVALLVAAHLGATCWALPPTGIVRWPFLAQKDFPVHTHRAYVYRESMRETGVGWGIDPAVNAGILLHPTQDVGSAPYAVAAQGFPSAPAGQVVTACAWLMILISPLLVVGAARLWQLDWEVTAWALLLAMGLLWFAPLHRTMLRVGMVAFLSSTYGSLFVLAAYDRFLARPSLLGLGGATAAGGFLFFVHPFGPLAIVPALVVRVATAGAAGWTWRGLAALSPVAIAAMNWFWLVPVLQGLKAVPPPWASSIQIQHPFFNWEGWQEMARWFGPGVFAAHCVFLGVGIVGLVGFARQRKSHVASGLALVLLTTLSLYLLGSFWSVTRILQPVRFGATWWTVLAVITGQVLVSTRQRLKLPGWVSALLLIGATLGVAIAFGLFKPPLQNSAEATAILRFVADETHPADRLLIEAVGLDHKLGQALPEALGREVISNSFPDSQDPVQFSPERLFGRAAADWTDEELAAALDRWGVNWVLVKSPAWVELFEQRVGKPGAPVGQFSAFHVSHDHSRCLVGRGTVKAAVNRIELGDVTAEADRVVLRYRYHPGWTCEAPSELESFPTPENGGGLLCIRRPQPGMVLKFDPVRALQSPWPDVSKVEQR